jgi:hypothetical protein
VLGAVDRISTDIDRVNPYAERISPPICPDPKENLKDSICEDIWQYRTLSTRQIRRKPEEMQISADRLDRLRYLSKGDRHDCLDLQIAIIILVIS